jgi:hypothetical protein
MTSGRYEKAGKKGHPKGMRRLERRAILKV